LNKEKKAMDPTSPVSRPNVVMVESTARPTPRPSRVSFGEVLAAGATTLVNGAEVAMSKIPGSPVSAAAVRGSPSPGPMTIMSAGVPVNATPEGPGASVGLSGGGLAAGGVGSVGVGSGVGVSVGGVGVSVGGAPGGTDPTGGVEAALQQSAAQSLYYLQIQQQEDSQNRTFTALSNVLKTEHDTAKNAIGNIHS
jgi:hypothetical protein